MKALERRSTTAQGWLLPAAAVVCVALLGATACSSSKAKHAEPEAATTTTRPHPDGPTADMSHEITGGKGVFIGSAAPATLEQVGYVEHEYVAAGTATSYK